MSMAAPHTAADRFAGKAILLVTMVLVLVAVLGPIGMLLYAAFRTGTPGTPDASWTLDNVHQVYSSGEILGPLWNTVLTCGLGTLIAVVLGFFLAWLIHRTDIYGRRWLESSLLIPIYFSPLSLAVGWVVLASPRIGLLNVVWPFSRSIVDVYTLTAIILFIGLYYTPYVYLVAGGALRSLDAGYEDASAILGGRPLQTLRRVTLPMLRPQLVASSLLVFILSISMFAEPALFGARIDFVNLPLAVLRAITSVPANFNLAATIGTVMLLGAVAGLLLYRMALSSSERFVTTQGRGFSEKRTALGRARPFASGFAIVYLLAVVGLPVIALVYTSFLRYLSPRLSFSRFTLVNYVDALNNPMVIDAIRNTLILSVGVATITTVFGFLVAYIIVRREIRGASVLDAVSILPIGVPAIVLSVGFLWAYLWAPIGIYGTIWALMVALSTVIIPNTIRNLDAAMRQLGTDVEFAARILGAGTFRRILHITLPMLRGPLISAWLLAFMLTTIQVSVPIILRTPGQEVLSVAVWSLVTGSGDLGQGSVVALLQGVIAGIVVLLARWVGRENRQ